MGPLGGDGGVGGALGGGIGVVEVGVAGVADAMGPGGGGGFVSSVALAEPGRIAGFESEMLALVATSGFFASAKHL